MLPRDPCREADRDRARRALATSRSEIGELYQVVNGLDEALVSLAASDTGDEDTASVLEAYKKALTRRFDRAIMAPSATWWECGACGEAALVTIGDGGRQAEAAIRHTPGCPRDPDPRRRL